MNSKSILILGIVIIFLLNVLAIHNYINKYYYKVPYNKDKISVKIPSQQNQSQDIDINKSIVNRDEPKDNTSHIIVEKNNTQEPQDINKNIEKVEEDKKVKIKKVNTFQKYKNYYTFEMKNFQIELDDIFRQIAEDEKKQKEQEEKIEKEEELSNTTLQTDEEESNQEDSVDKYAITSFSINVNEPLSQKYNQLLNISSKMDDTKKIVIKIYQYSTKISSYLKQIKDKLVNNGIDIDDIEVIYKKRFDYKDKIKVLLIKKDVL